MDSAGRQLTCARDLLQLLFQLTPLYLEEPFSAGGGLSEDDFLRGLPLLDTLKADPSAAISRAQSVR